jgi:hypothetical protein
MPFQKGRAKTGGRQKGTFNRTPAQREAEKAAKKAQQETARLAFGSDFKAALMQLSAARLTPLEVMHAVMFIKVAHGDYDGAIEVAEKAAPFCHAKLNAAEVRVQHSVAGRSDDELAANILALREKLSIATQPQPLNGQIIDLVPEPASMAAEAATELVAKLSEHAEE